MNTSLIQAARSGNTEEFIRLTNNSADIFKLDADGHSLRWHAQQAQAKEILDAIAMLEEAYGRSMQDAPAPEPEPEPANTSPAEEENTPVPVLSEAKEELPCLLQSLHDDTFLATLQEMLQRGLRLTPGKAINDLLVGALKRRDFDTAECLLKLGADVDQVPLDELESPFEWKKAEETDELLRMYELPLRYGAYANVQWTEYSTMLEECILNGRPRLARLLLVNGADSEPFMLHAAILGAETNQEREWQELIETLVRDGADINEKHYFSDYRPLDLAETSSMKQCLRKLGATHSIKHYLAWPSATLRVLFLLFAFCMFCFGLMAFIELCPWFNNH